MRVPSQELGTQMGGMDYAAVSVGLRRFDSRLKQDRKMRGAFKNIVERHSDVTLLSFIQKSRMKTRLAKRHGCSPDENGWHWTVGCPSVPLRFPQRGSCQES
jgi:hypothetical protein